MKITFLGAAKTVTGSCYLVETQKCKFIIDCGMFQGHSKEEEMNSESFPFNPAELSCVILTHAHIDHSGRIPKLWLDGFRGPIFATKATVELCSIMLPDSGHIQEFENEWINRKRKRAGQKPVPPLYTNQDAIDCLHLFKPINYSEEISLNECVRMRMSDAGHLLGSAILELWVVDEGKETKIVFSGDLGNKDVPLLKDPTPIESADYLIVESTYGNRIHEPIHDQTEKFLHIINETIERGGNVIIPSFAVGRTQEILYDLNRHYEKNDIEYRNLLSTPVFVDSPLAMSATKVYRDNLNYFDEETKKYIENGDNPLDFPGLQFTKTADESKLLNERKGSAIIISASGMCEAGRIKHHLKHNLWRPESTILFVGYQAEGTLGRRLVDGEKRVRIFGEEINVKARIEMISGFSGHADKTGLLRWLAGFKQKPQKVFLVHGDPSVIEEYSETVKNELRLNTIIPDKGNEYILKGAGEIVPVLEAAKTETVSRTMQHRFKQLEALELLDKIKGELSESANLIRNVLDKDKDAEQIDEMIARLKNLEESLSTLVFK